MSMRYRRILAGLITLALIALPGMATPASAAKGEKAEHKRLARFWTPARQRAAIPRDFVKTARGFRPVKKPDWAGGNGSGDGGDETTDSSAVTGATWSDSNAEVRSAVGKAFFTMNGTLYTCSGSVTNDTRNDGLSGYSLVLTAAHCAYDERNNSFAQDWVFFPDYQSAPNRSCADSEYGCWHAQALAVPKDYADQSTFNNAATRADFAFAVVGAGGKPDQSKQLDDTVGSFPIATSAFSAGTEMAAFGYPSAKKYKGTKLTYCQGPIFFDASNDNKTYGMTCDMTGGSSGGPWLSADLASNKTLADGSGIQSSLNSYGRRGSDAMYGPRFNALTQRVYEAANAATAEIAPVP